jgi:hypothetical protein
VSRSQSGLYRRLSTLRSIATEDGLAGRAVSVGRTFRLVLLMGRSPISRALGPRLCPFIGQDKSAVFIGCQRRADALLHPLPRHPAGPVPCTTAFRTLPAMNHSSVECAWPNRTSNIDAAGLQTFVQATIAANLFRWDPKAVILEPAIAGPLLVFRPMDVPFIRRTEVAAITATSNDGSHSGSNWRF